jgi:hypothetical protein
MVLSLYEAARISRNPYTKGILLGIATDNEVMSRFPWVTQPGSALSYTREGTLADVEFVSPTHTSLTESTSTFDRVTVPLRLVDSDMDVYNYTANQSDPNGDPWAIQLSKKLKALGRKLAAKMITGGWGTGFVVSGAGVSPGAAVSAVTQGPGLDTDLLGPAALKYTHSNQSWQFRGPGDRTFGAAVVATTNGAYTLYSDNASKYIVVTLTVASATADGECSIRFTTSTNEPDGLLKLIPPSQVVVSKAANGDTFSFDVLDQLLLEKVKVKENLAYFMNASLKRKFLSYVRSASGGLMPEQLALPVLGMDGRDTKVMVPQYNGIPILQIDDIPSNEAKGSSSNLSSIFLASLTPDEGFWGVAQQEGAGVDSDLNPFRTRLMGVKVYDVGQLENKAARRTRVEWYGAYALGSILAAARASEIVTT